MTDKELEGKCVAFLVANEGVEEQELTEPWKAIESAGATPELIAPEPDDVQAFNHLDKAGRFEVNCPVGEADAADYDALVLPGGVANPDRLRQDDRALSFVRQFFDAGKPVAAICHAPWALIEAGVVDGRTMTSWPSVRTDLVNAGANWVDAEVCVDGGLVTSRGPDDLDAFCRKAIEEIAEGVHARQRDAAAASA